MRTYVHSTTFLMMLPVYPGTTLDLSITAARQSPTGYGCVDTSHDGSVSIAEVQKVMNGFLGL